MKNLYSIALLLFSVSFLSAQVGINTTTPTAALDVAGNVLVEGSLFLENPGDNTEIRGSKLLILSTDASIKQYDIDISKYGPINYVQFAFENLSKDGLLDYDTKISTSKYLVSIQGYYFLVAGNGSTNLQTHSLVDDDNIEGFQIYAYQNTSTSTWFLRAFVNNSEFHTYSGGGYEMEATPVDMFLNLIIYRRGFISKEQNAITVDMGNSETITAPLPTGF